jgi:thiol-disulfide isomerase/thioredoxin
MGNLHKRNTAKYSFAIIAVISAVLMPQTSIGLQAAQARPATVGNFKLQNVAGGLMSSDDLKGKVAVVDMFAVWCGPCKEEIPIFNQLYDTFKGRDVAIVGIAVESSQSDIPAKVRQLNIKYPVLIGGDEAYRAFGRVQGFPTTFVLSKDGKVYKRYVGSTPKIREKIIQDIEHLLAEDSH